MPSARRKFQRPLGTRRYRKIFVIAAEGTVTEPQYFAIFNSEQSIVHVNCIRNKHHSAPPQVLQRMRISLKTMGLKSSDEAWLVVDKDQWTNEQLLELFHWSNEAPNYGFALSNPKFEFWLLLHFEDGNGVANPHICSQRLKSHLPNYDKGIDPSKFTYDSINDAIRRAKQRDNPPCEDWPQTCGGTTVYKLVENILKSN